MLFVAALRKVQILVVRVCMCDGWGHTPVHMYMHGWGMLGTAHCCLTPLTCVLHYPATCAPLACRRCLACLESLRECFPRDVWVGEGFGGPAEPSPAPVAMVAGKPHTTFLPASLLWRFMRARLDEAPLLLSRTSTKDCEKATP